MNVLIVEDENKTACLLKDMIENQGNYLVVNICQTISSSVQYLKKNQSKINLIFMDIQLADGDSFEIFNLMEVTKPVIFCTAYNDYMLKAFKNNGIDYILKPFKQRDVVNALKKIDLLQNTFDHTIMAKIQTASQTNSFQTSFIVQKKEKMIPLSVFSIAFIYIENDIIYAVNFDNEKSSIFKSLDEIENVLNPIHFFRINRQMLVNRKAVKNIVPYFNRKLKVNLNIKHTDKVVVSRLKVSRFKQWLEKPE